MGAFTPGASQGRGRSHRGRHRGRGRSHRGRQIGVYTGDVTLHDVSVNGRVWVNSRCVRRMRCVPIQVQLRRQGDAFAGVCARVCVSVSEE